MIGGKFFYKNLLLVCTLNIINTISANQNNNPFIKISGVVINAETGKGLSQVNVLIINSDVGTTTDLNGKFTLSGLFELPLTLEVSHIGYKTKKNIIDKQVDSEIKFMLSREFLTMNELVVTATRTKKLHDNVPIATEIITKNDIENSGSRNIADLLSQRSGVSLQTSVEGGTVLNILGMDSRYILILMDGQPITGRFNNRVALDQILTSRVIKVEIVKGPNSSLYGSEAMAGVINIITDDEKNSQLINLTTRYNNTENKILNDGFNNGSRNISINGVKPFKDVRIKFNADFDVIENDKSIQLIKIDKVDKRTFGGSIDWKPNKNHKISFDIQTYGQYEKGESKLMNTNTDILRNNFSLSHRFINQNKWNYEQSITTNSYSRNYVQVRPWGDLEKDDTTSEEYVEYELLLNRKFGANVLSTGLEIYNALYRSDRVSFGKQKIMNHSVFGQYDFNIQNHLSTIFGLRVDNYSEYSSVISPRIGLMYRYKENWKFRTSWGKGFRAPSFMERFIDWNHIQFNYSVIGNSELEPERSDGITIGLEYTSLTKYQMSIMFYYTQFENLIEDFTIKPGLLSYQNIEEATFSGLEFMYQWKISNQWDTRWGINWINNRDGDDIIIPNTIPISISGMVNYKYPNNFLNISINTKWVGSYRPQEYDPQKGEYVFAQEKLKAYALIMLRSTININNHFTISLGVDNAGDYTNNRFGPFVGRAAYIEFSTKLEKGK